MTLAVLCAAAAILALIAVWRKRWSYHLLAPEAIRGDPEQAKGSKKPSQASPKTPTKPRPTTPKPATPASPANNGRRRPPSLSMDDISPEDKRADELEAQAGDGQGTFVQDVFAEAAVTPSNAFQSRVSLALQDEKVFEAVL